MTALEYLKQPMKYQTFLGGGMFSSLEPNASRAMTMKLLSELEKTKQAKAKELNRARRDKTLADNLLGDTQKPS